jgi:hypothetical protein
MDAEFRRVRDSIKSYCANLINTYLAS